MKWWVLFTLLMVSVAVFAEDEESEEEIQCSDELCQLPSCRCSSTDIPGGLLPRNVPQFVTLTFDGAINTVNIETFRDNLYNRRNSNGCPAGVTFFINHEYNNYQLVNELYNRGYEIGLRSITQLSDQEYWATATYERMVAEFADQRTQMAHFASIPAATLIGMRLPMLQMTGNSSFEMMASHGFLYDSSWPTTTFQDPAMWPYTLDFPSTQDCTVPPCPTKSIPGPWVKPIVAWQDRQGVPCSFVNTCFWVPGLTDAQGWYEFFLTNFERHYRGNRAPFPFNVNEAFLSSYPAIRTAFVRFLNLINNLNDVFMVTSQEVINWVRNPIPIDEYKRQACRSFTPSSCRMASCGPYIASHNQMEYWLQLCNQCPRVYPWLGNPLGTV